METNNINTNKKLHASGAVSKDKCFQILKMMTEKLHGSLTAVSSNVIKLCSLLGVQVLYLKPPTPFGKESGDSERHLVSHDWSTTIEQELAHLTSTVNTTQRKVSKFIMTPIPEVQPSTTTKEDEANQQKILASAKSWLDDFMESFVIPTEKAAHSNNSISMPLASPRPHSHHATQVSHPLHVPNLHYIPAHGTNYSNVHFPHHSPNHQYNSHYGHHSHRIHRTELQSSIDTPIPIKQQQQHTKHVLSTDGESDVFHTPPSKPNKLNKSSKHYKSSKNLRKESDNNPTKRMLAERLSERFSFRKRVTPELSVLPPSLDLSCLSPPLTLRESQTSIDGKSQPPSPCVPTSPNPFTPSDSETAQESDNYTPDRAHGFSSDDEALPRVTRTPVVRRRSQFESEGEKEREGSEKEGDEDGEERGGKEKRRTSTWRLWSRSTGNSTDEEFSVPERKRGLSRKSKFRLRLFESKE